MGRLAISGTLAVVALAPLPFGSNRPGPWSALALAVGLLLILWAAAALRQPEQWSLAWRSHWPATAAFLALLSWLYLQSVPWTPESWHNPAWTTASAALGKPLAGAVSIDPGETRTALMRLTTYGAVLWLGMNLFHTHALQRIALWCVALAGSAYALYGIGNELAGSSSILWYAKWAYLDSLTGTFVNRNSYAAYAGIALIATLALLKRQLRDVGGDPSASPADVLDRAVRRGGALAMLAIVLGASVLLSRSRGGLLATGAGIAAMLLIGVIEGRSQGASRRFEIGAVVALVALLAIGGSGTFDRISGLGDDATVQRSAIYERTLAGIAEHPWAGTGYGTFETAFAGLSDARFVTALRIDKAHNSYLEFALEAGLPALALLLGVLAWFCGRCVAALIGRRHGVAAIETALASSVLLAVHSMVDFSVQIPAIAVTYALLLGAGFRQALTPLSRAGAV
ncbi:MAG TPA: O-antigen ligase family protein [Candidatus Cybelea sp.]|nr:O-antigen ligase family protein [Candidatus Cybelea sp.]